MDGSRPELASAPVRAGAAGERPASRTAYRVALRRAAHQVLDVPPVLDDPIAIPILGEETAAALRKDPSAFERGPLDQYMRAFMAARSRFAEDHLDAARDHGVGQYVILGAGLDTFAYRQRRADPPLRVWEIDHPATQAWKRERLAAAGIAIPANVTHVPVDFERERLPDALVQAGFDPSGPTVFAWLGVTPYLTADAIDATLAYVATVAGPNGGVAFDYGLERSLLTVAQKVVFDRLAARVASAGEPWITMFEPAALAARLRALGFTTIEDAGADDVNARYFAGRTDGLRVGGMGRMMWAGCS
jgi:methyltransferase (TIGR00027 family)